MEIKKKKNHANSFYIPLLLILVVIAGIVAVATTIREEKRTLTNEDENEAVSVVAPAPSASGKDLPRESVPEEKDEKTDEAAVTETEEITESESESAAEEAPEEVIPTFISPVGGVVIKGFSDTVPVFSETMNDYRVHAGVDISGEEGEAVLAAADGTVGAVWSDPLMGTCMTVVHDGGFVTTYKGLNEIIPDGIAQGVAVKGGEPIGALGETALIEVAEEPHVHFEMTAGGEAVDPCQYVTFAASETYEE